MRSGARGHDLRSRPAAALVLLLGLAGLLAAGLFWGLLQGAAGRPAVFFFIGCVIVAGLYGAMTSSRKILFVQALPGAVALALVLAAG